MPRRKGSWPAVSETEVVGARRLRLFAEYDRDDETGAWVKGVYARYWTTLAPTFRRYPEYLPDAPDAIARAIGGPDGDAVTDYLRALRWEARRFGLDRIPRVGPGPWQRRHHATYIPSGIAQAHALLWHLDKFRLWEAAPERHVQPDDAMTRPTFMTVASFGTPVPTGDLRVGDTSETWDPREETFADARRRIVAASGRPESEVETGLTVIVDAGGYRLPDTKSRLDRAARWTFLRLRHRWTYGQIAETWHAEHPLDINLRPPDDEARRWEAEHRDESPPEFDAGQAVGQVRKAV